MYTYSHNFLVLSVPFAHTELGKKAFIHSVPFSWYLLQGTFRLTEFISFSAFKPKLIVLEANLKTSTCFL